jgi:hypothetical protein
LLFIEAWEKILNEGKEVMVLGDINLAFLKWNMAKLPASDSSVKLKQLSKLIFSSIFPHGVSQLVSTPTRISPVHLYTHPQARHVLSTAAD